MSKRSHSQSSSKEEASPGARKASRFQDEHSPEGLRASCPQAEGAHRNGGRLPKAQSHKKSSQQKEGHNEEEDEEDARDVCSTPVKDFEGEVTGLPSSGGSCFRISVCWE